jgi:hypothetical protein
MFELRDERIGTKDPNTFQVLISQGQRVEVIVADSDGVIVVDYNYGGDDHFRVLDAFEEKVLLDQDFSSPPSGDEGAVEPTDEDRFGRLGQG